MTTRGSLARGQGKETFQGRVQKWIKKLSPVGGRQGSQQLTILKWVPTGEKSQAPDGPRWPQIVPVKSSGARTPISPQQRKATQAAPTLRLKLRQSQAQLSTPGSDEDPSRRQTRWRQLSHWASIQQALRRRATEEQPVRRRQGRPGGPVSTRAPVNPQRTDKPGTDLSSARTQLTSAVETSGGAVADGGGAAAGDGQEAQSPRAPQRPAAHAPPQAAGAAASALRHPQQAAAPAASEFVDEHRGINIRALQGGPSAGEPAARQLAADGRAPAAAAGAAEAPRVVASGLPEAGGSAAEPADASASQARAGHTETGRSAGPSLVAAGGGAAEPAGGSAGVPGAAGAAGRGGGGSEALRSADSGMPAVAGAKRGREGAAQEPAAGDLRAAERGDGRGGEANAAKRARSGEGS